MEQEAGDPEPEAAPEPVPVAPSAEAGPAPTEAAAPAADGEVPPKPRPRQRNSALARAYRTGRPVQGQVAAVIKGGYEIHFGAARGFCPHSQIDVHREDQPEQRIGQTYPFRITQIRRGGDDVVVSRRALIEEQRAEEAKAVRATLIEGAVMQGHVVSAAPFGAFVDLGAGVQGLVHISELAHERVRSVEEVVKAGDIVRVRILKLNDQTGKISLSIRQAEPDPWDGVAERFPPAALVPGAVTRLATFGVFVELAPGVEALAPASEMPPTDPEWRQSLQPGVTEQWWVLAVDARARRISVTLPGGATPPLPELAVGALLRGRVQRVERYGVFVWLGPGRVGLIPHGGPGTERLDLRRAFPIGDEIEVQVVDLGTDGHRIRLARPGVEPAAAEPRQPAAPVVREQPDRRDRRDDKKKDAPPAAQDEGSQTFGTSLGDKLREALRRS